MHEDFKLVSRQPDGGRVPEYLSPDTAAGVRRFHESFPQYVPTPLVSLEDTAKALGVGKIWVKDESKRFGLNAFKVLGGSYAMGRVLADRLGIPMDQVTCGLLTNPATRERLGDITFVTATDGNHGRGIAWSAARFGQKSVVYMPRGSALERLEENIRRYREAIQAGDRDALVQKLSYSSARKRKMNRLEEESGAVGRERGTDAFADRR